jgi:hypothetical protein
MTDDKIDALIACAWLAMRGTGKDKHIFLDKYPDLDFYEVIEDALFKPRPQAPSGDVEKTLLVLSQYYGQMPRDDYDFLDAQIRALSQAQHREIEGGWQPIDDISKTIATGLWLKFPDGHIEWGKWGYSPNADITAFGSYPIDEFGNRMTGLFLPFKTQPVYYFIERRKSTSTPPKGE